MTDEENIHFVDIETFGLDADRHAIFEIATCGLLPDTPCHTFFLEPAGEELGAATDHALQLTNYYNRLIEHRPAVLDVHHLLAATGPESSFDRALSEEPRQGEVIWVPLIRRTILAEYLAWKLNGHLAGNSVSFDALRLDKWLRRHGAAPQWNYHLLDVEAYAAGALGLLPDWKSSDLSDTLGVKKPEGKDRHTAAADVAWSRDMFLAAVNLSDMNRTDGDKVLPERVRSTHSS